jgi:manganese transport protein
MLAFAGPAYLVSVGYMDPGNWATDLEGGAKFGYNLLWVLVMSNAMAILLQTLSARLGVVSGRDLAQACRETYPRPVNHALWALCEIAIAACDLAEVLGAAIGLNLLFQLPLLVGVLVTAGDTLLLLWLQQYRIRTLEAVVLRLIVIIGACLGMEIFLAKPGAAEIVAGVVPRLDRDSLFTIIAILGATVMPHNLYLHSSLVQTRRIGGDTAARRRACRYNLADTLVALNGAMLVNIAILVLAAAVFFKRGIVVTEIQQAPELLVPLLGTKAAGVIFAVALLCAGQASTLTGTMAGQIVMEGFLNFRMRAWLRRLVTRLLAIIPAALTVYFAGNVGAFKLLLLTQVVLSMQLPFAVIPLVHFTDDRGRMGEFANRNWLRWLAWMAAGVILLLNVWLARLRLAEWLAIEAPYRTLIWFLIVPLVAGLILLLLYILLTPWLRLLKTDAAPAGLPGPARGGPDVPVYLDHVDGDEARQLTEERFDAFMTHLRGIAFIKDPAGRYVYLNGACSTVLGLDLEQVLSKPDDEIWPPQLASVYKNNDQIVFRDQKTFEGIELIPQNGEMHSWLIYKFPIIERQTQTVFLGGVGVDITDRKQLEEQLLQARKFEVIEGLAGGVAHHFNNLLMVISGYSRMALEDLAPTHKSRVRLEEVLNAADRATCLTRELLAFSRRQMFQLRTLDLNCLVFSTGNTLRRIVGERIQLSFELTAQRALVKVDARYVEQILTALALNARDAMEGAGGKLTFATANAESAGRSVVRLSIRDTGVGMDESTKKHLFEPFFTTKKTGEGTGLSLASVYGIVKQHGGEVTVDSEIGAGATFHIYFPCDAASD